MISTDILIIESARGWFVVGQNNMGPFSLRETAVHLAERLRASLRMSGVPSTLYMLERHPRDLTGSGPTAAHHDPRIPPKTLEAVKQVAREGGITPADGVVLFKQTRHRDGSRSFGSGPTPRLASGLAEAFPGAASGAIAIVESLRFGPERAGSNAPIKVLCAEDNPANQRLLAIVLKLAGIHHTMVDNGAAAVRAWEQEAWDLILMDIQMPGTDGVTATRTIRQREIESGRPRTPIVAVTADAMVFQIAEYGAAGMDGFVAKPVDPNQLLLVLQRILDARPATEAEQAPGSLRTGET